MNSESVVIEKRQLKIPFPKGLRRHRLPSDQYLKIRQSLLIRSSRHFHLKRAMYSGSNYKVLARVKSLRSWK